jgi:hypothetical protein
MLERCYIYRSCLTCAAFLAILMLTAMCEMEMNDSVAYIATTSYNIRNWLANQLGFRNVHTREVETINKHILPPDATQKLVTPVTNHSAIYCLYYP